MNNYRQMILLDFDGVLHSYTSGWKGADNIPDEPVPGAMKYVHDMVRYSDYNVGIFSARNNQEGGPKAIKEWLHAKLCEYMGMTNQASRAVVEEISIVTHKPPEAFILIDDRGFCFRGTFPSLIELESFKPWYK